MLQNKMHVCNDFSVRYVLTQVSKGKLTQSYQRRLGLAESCYCYSYQHFHSLSPILAELFTKQFPGQFSGGNHFVAFMASIRQRIFFGNAGAPVVSPL